MQTNFHFYHHLPAQLYPSEPVSTHFSHTVLKLSRQGDLVFPPAFPLSTVGSESKSCKSRPSGRTCCCASVLDAAVLCISSGIARARRGRRWVSGIVAVCALGIHLYSTSSIAFRVTIQLLPGCHKTEHHAPSIHIWADAVLEWPSLVSSPCSLDSTSQ